MISIIGTGRVGSALGFLTAATSLDDVVLVNRNKNKAMGEALDIVNTIPKNSSISVTGTDDFEQIFGSQVIVIATGAGKIVTDRSDLIPYTVPMIHDMSKKIIKYAGDAKIIVVTNPVDVITYCVLQETGISSKNVIGMGSSLDSDRFRYLLSKVLHANQSKIESLVLGEHGNSMVPIFSQVKFNEKPVNLNESQIASITNDVRNYWKPLTDLKGASVFGAARHSYDIVRAIVKNEQLRVPASVMVQGEYDISNICIGVPVSIDATGASIEKIDIDKNELDSLKISADVIKNNIKKI
ncbi:MAG TPA: lactate dehydrogenase [Candidatus Nitrosotalea sp.]|nr:lactate dehydrogenase [Candidatus Nitrosotalea sp.]